MQEEQQEVVEQGLNSASGLAMTTGLTWQSSLSLLHRAVVPRCKC